jgi:general secretion pathway protein D
MGSPVELKPISNEPLTLHMTEDAKVVYQAIGKAAGINVLFDPDYTSKRIQVDLNNDRCSTRCALWAPCPTPSGARSPTTRSLWPQNTRAKRTELDEQAVQTFYLTNAWQQNDLNDVQTAMRNVLPTRQGLRRAQPERDRDPRHARRAAAGAKADQRPGQGAPEVVVDIAVLEVSKNWERTLGIAWPSSVGIALQPPDLQQQHTTTPPCTGHHRHHRHQRHQPDALRPGPPEGDRFCRDHRLGHANLLLTDSNTKILQNPRIRATDGQKATMKIGEKIPIATGSYQTGAATAVVSSLVNTQFQYQDVGVNIEMTPTVHYDHDVTLKIKIEVSSQSGSVTISGVTEPILSQRVVDQVIRLREGEASILGGIQDKQDR